MKCREGRANIPGAVRGAGVLGTWLVLFVAGCGSRGPSASSAGDNDQAPHETASAETGGDQTETAQTPDGVLRQMIATYRNADSYRDQGTFRAVYRGEETVEDAAPLSVAWSKPNRIAVRAYQAAVACDGKQLRARIFDAPSGDLDGQVMVQPAPDKLRLDHIFSDAVLRESLGGRLGLHPMQLELLLTENPLAAFFDPKATKRFLEPQEFDGRMCLRIEADLEGRYVFWIDREIFLLRRFDYPSEGLLAGDGAAPGELSISAEFRGAEIGGHVEKGRFTLAAMDAASPENARQVRFFVVPPQPLPTQMFGKRPEGFEFLQLDGGKVTADSLRGKIAALAWFSNHPGSQACLKALDEVRRQFADDPQVVFYGVCTEPSSMSNEEIRRLAEFWGVEIPIVRDLGAYGRDVFDVRVAPSLVVLDAKGAVQIHESASNPQLAALVEEQFAELLRRLAAGEDFAAAILAQAENEREQYLLNLRAASAEGEAMADALQPADIAPKSEPQRLKLSSLWSNDNLAQPGNLLVVEDNGSRRVLALDGRRAVAELDASGKLLRRTELDLPEGAAVTYLRTERDGNGRRYFAASLLLAPQVHVFDDQWKRVFSYPSPEQEHDGIRDVLLARLDDQSGPTLAVGFWGVVGVHGVDLQGRRQWSNRDLFPVLSLAATPKDVVGWRKLLATGNDGYILRLNQYGNADPPIQVRGRAIHHLIAADWPADRPTIYLGLSYTPEGSLLAIGLSNDFEEMWSYRLPPGAYSNEIQIATSCQLFGNPGGQWLLAGPDGSVHLISDGGEFFDYFQTGENLTGLTAARITQDNALFIATDHGVQALRVERPE